MKKSIFILLLFCSFTGLFCQKTAYEYDTLTLHYYYFGNWDSLIMVGDEAIKNDVDFFYLRSRMGYAAFSLGYYRNAVRHFEKAHLLNSYDDFVKYYLYLSYKNAGMTSEANYFGDKLNDSAKVTVDYELPFVSNFYIESGLGLPDSKLNQISKKEQFLVAKSSNKNMFYGIFGFNHHLGKNISLFHTFSNYQMNDLDVYGNQNQKNDVDIKMDIMQYYFAPSFRLFKRTTFNPYFHVSSIKTQVSQPYPIFNTPGQDPMFQFRTIDTTIFDFSFGGNVFRNTNFGGISAGLSMNRYSGVSTFQQNLGLLWYPLKSNKLYFKTDFQHLMTKDSVTNSRFNFEQVLGFSITPKIWSELFWVHGNITGSNMSNGYLLYNGLHRQKEMFGIKLSYFSTKANFFIRAQYAQYESDYLKYELGQISYYNTSNFNKINIIGGLLWKL